MHLNKRRAGGHDRRERSAACTRARTSSRSSSAARRPRRGAAPDERSHPRRIAHRHGAPDGGEPQRRPRETAVVTIGKPPRRHEVEHPAHDRAPRGHGCARSTWTSRRPSRRASARSRRPSPRRTARPSSTCSATTTPRRQRRRPDRARARGGDGARRRGAVSDFLDDRLRGHVALHDEGAGLLLVRRLGERGPEQDVRAPLGRFNPEESALPARGRAGGARDRARLRGSRARERRRGAERPVAHHPARRREAGAGSSGLDGPARRGIRRGGRGCRRDRRARRADTPAPAARSSCRRRTRAGARSSS